MVAATIKLMPQFTINIIEMFERQGKAIGVITSVEWSHATPAGFVAHNVARGNYEQIAQEIIYDSAVDVIMGCDTPMYDADGIKKDTPDDFKYVGGESTWNKIAAGIAGGDADGDGDKDPWILVQSREAFQPWQAAKLPNV